LARSPSLVKFGMTHVRRAPQARAKSSRLDFRKTLSPLNKDMYRISCMMYSSISKRMKNILSGVKVVKGSFVSF
jgi:hypothetical protein